MLRDRRIGRVAGSGSKGYGDMERRGEEWGTRYCWERGGGDLGKKYKKRGRGREIIKLDKGTRM